MLAPLDGEVVPGGVEQERDDLVMGQAPEPGSQRGLVDRRGGGCRPV
ncbi:MAG: hypothetical protein ACQETV_07150 [Actinomycetota bacterium]